MIHRCVCVSVRVCVSVFPASATHSGAILGAGLSQGKSTSLNLKTKFLVPATLPQRVCVCTDMGYLAHNCNFDNALPSLPARRFETMWRSVTLSCAVLLLVWLPHLEHRLEECCLR